MSKVKTAASVKTAEQADGKESRKILRGDGSRRNAPDIAEEKHKRYIENDVHSARDHKKYKRMPCIAVGAQYRRAVVVDHLRGYPEEYYTHVSCGLFDAFLNCTHKLKQGLAGQ